MAYDPKKFTPKTESKKRSIRIFKVCECKGKNKKCKKCSGTGIIDTGKTGTL